MSEHKDAITTPAPTVTPIPDEHNPQVQVMSAAEFERLRRENTQLRVSCQQATAALERVLAELDAMVARCNQLARIGGVR